VETIRQLLYIRSAGHARTLFFLSFFLLWRIGWILHVYIKWNAGKYGCMVLNTAIVLGNNVNYCIVNDGVLIIQPIHNIQPTQSTMFFPRYISHYNTEYSYMFQSAWHHYQETSVKCRIKCN